MCCMAEIWGMKEMTDLQIRCFLEVAKCLSFTKAAKHLFISQSNISRQIASLEEEWELPLFDRNTKGGKTDRIRADSRGDAG